MNFLLCFEEWFLEAIDNGFILNESPFTLLRNTSCDLLVKVNRPSTSGLPYSQMSWIEAKKLMKLNELKFCKFNNLLAEGG